jgi:di/tricarboxylate transporter
VNKKKVFGSLLFSFALLAGFPSPSRAVDIGKEYGSSVNALSDVGKIVTSVSSSLYIAAGVVLLVLVLWGGLEIVRGAGSDDRDQVGKGQKIIGAAVSGFLLIFISYWIIQIIELLTNVNIL